MSKTDPVILSFHDSSLRMSDIKLLNGQLWLNDQILSFYYEYLSHVKYKNNNMYFIGPEVTQCMKYMAESELKILLDKNDAIYKSFIFFALNDNGATEEGGTHWSLLVLSQPEETFFHFDSFGNCNVDISVKLMNRLKNFLCVPMAKFCPMRCLQQVNGYDCGIHVICMTEHIASHVSYNGMIRGLGPLDIETVQAKRADLLDLIFSLGGAC